jgi:transglutaminase-like putative cysteine protease
MEKEAVRRWDWVAAVLLFLLLQVPPARLVTTDWTPFLYFTESLTSFGTVLGLAAGASRYRPRIVRWLMVEYTLVVVPLQVSGASSASSLAERLRGVGGALLVSMQQFLRRQPVPEPMLFLAFVCLGFWIIAMLSGYWLARHGRVLGPLFLSGTALVVIQAYGDYQSHGSWWLAVFLILALLLAGRANFRANLPGWVQRRVFVNEEAWPNIFGSLLVTAAAAVLLAWQIPASRSGFEQITDTWHKLTQPMRDRLSNAVTSLNGPYGKPTGNYYGSTLALGESAASGDMTMFVVKALDAPQGNVRLYWRGRTYDDYKDDKWSEASSTAFQFDPGQADLAVVNRGGRVAARMAVTTEFPSQTLIYAPSLIVWLDRPAQVQAVRSPAGDYDTLYWLAHTALGAGGTYQVRSEIVNPTVEELRAAGDRYPDWIRARDLGVPADLLPLFRARAESITVGAATPFDQAAAITAYLRSNIEYATEVPSAPPGQDAVWWVLTDYKQGFCNYYASAEVLLLRSLGIPARLAVGFAQGEAAEGQYVVRRRDAHAWPEAYFPGIGWVEFEPTANQAPLFRPTGSPGGSAADLGAPPSRFGAGEEGASLEPPSGASSGAVAPVSGSPWESMVVLVLGLAALAVFLVLARRIGLWRRVPGYISRAVEREGPAAPGWLVALDRWNQIEPIERAFASVNWSLRLLRVPTQAAATAAERASQLSDAVPAAAGSIQFLEAELRKALYSNGQPDLAGARRASFRLLLQALLRTIERTVLHTQSRDVYSSPSR